MTDFLVGGSAWWMVPATLFTMAMVFGLFPGVALRLIVLLYPKDDPRRRELVAELYTLDRMQRIEWVFQQLETGLFEGLSRRLAQRRERWRREREDDPGLQETSETLPSRTDDGQLSIAVRRSEIVTSDAWEDPEMRVALAAREVSTVYRLLRRRGVSQRQIAAMTGQSQSEVSEILKGRQVMAYDVLVRVADGLGVPRGYMGLAYDEVTAARMALEAADWVKFFNEDDVYSMIGTVHAVLAQTVDARHTKYAIPALTRAIDSYGDEVARNKTFNLSPLTTSHLLDGDGDCGYQDRPSGR